MTDKASHPDRTEVDAVIVGAGFAGMYMLHCLRDRLGLDVRVFEVADGVGGTWYWSRYPGARCDVQSHVYCYSFSKELLDEWDWSERYPQQPELLRYANHVADRFDLRRDISLETRVVSAHYHEDIQRWAVTTDRGHVVMARFFITGVGLLASVPYRPNFPGIDDFGGEVLHTGRWPHEPVDFTGKRVGMIGTGSTGMQAGPVIAPQAAHLHVFQRTPQYVIPARHADLTDEDREAIKADYDAIWERAKWSVGGFPFEHNGKSALEVSDEEREAEFERRWAAGGFRFLGESFKDLITDETANAHVSRFVREKMRASVDDPVLAEKLLPDPDLPLGGKRPIIAAGYLEMFERDDVTLVDVTEDPIQRVTPTGIQTATSHIGLDMIVLATGFDAVTGPFLRMDIRGRGGRRLGEKWGDSVRSYYGLAVAGFPNMFMITGPGSTFGNLMVSIEHHVEWITDCIAHLDAEGLGEIEADETAEAEWAETVDRQVARTVTGRVDSWFNGSNIPGKPRGTLVYFGHFGLYRGWVEEIAEAGYKGFHTAPRVDREVTGAR